MAVLPGPGPFSATSNGDPRHDRAGRGSFVLPVRRPAAPPPRSTAWRQSDLRVSPGLVLRRTSANGRTVIEATLDPARRRRSPGPRASPGRRHRHAM